MSDVDAVVQVVRELAERPRWKWSKVHRDDLRGERALPLLCLIGEPDRTTAAADALTARLFPDPALVDRPPRRLIPSASVDAGTVDPDTGPGRPLLPLLNHLVQALGPDRTASAPAGTTRSTPSAWSTGSPGTPPRRWSATGGRRCGRP